MRTLFLFKNMPRVEEHSQMRTHGTCHAPLRLAMCVAGLTAQAPRWSSSWRRGLRRTARWDAQGELRCWTASVSNVQGEQMHCHGKVRRPLLASCTWVNCSALVERVLLLRDKVARFLKEDLLRSKILSNYWYVRTHILPNIANITQHRQYVRQDACF